MKWCRLVNGVSLCGKLLKYTNLKVNSSNLDSLKILILVLGYFKKFPVFIVNITFTIFKIAK